MISKNQLIFQQLEIRFLHEKLLRPKGSVQLPQIKAQHKTIDVEVSKAYDMG